MEFSLFAHMDRVTPEQSYAELQQDFLALCAMADAGGMRAIWTGEHHGMDFTIAPNPFLTLVDLAHRTKNVRLGTGTVIAPFWHPIKLAGEAAMADLLTGGRLELGIARGAYSFEYERLVPGMDAAGAGARLREAASTIRGMWDGDHAHDGATWSFPSTSAVPSPVQEGGPPIWIAARDPASHAFAVANGFHVQVTPLWQGDGEIGSLMERFRAACAEHLPAGAPTPKIMLLHHLHVCADAEEVEQTCRDLSRWYATFAAWFKNDRPTRKGRLEPLTDAEVAANKMVSPEVMRANLAIGTADELVERLSRYRDLGFDEYALWLDNGLPADRKRASLSRFLDEVMPQVG
jgi:alkanesulfonate monooxygenase SsuD/methylene tetrahydromethanopterin reductase-like flavin-dependent oxidoreductase (luciferase family)